MTDTEILPRCPYCESFDVHELYGIYRAGYDSAGTDKTPAERKYKLFRCRDCGRDFDERELKE